MSIEAMKQALEELDNLGDDAAVHIWPDDLEKCGRSECVVQVYSVRMGSPNGTTVPLFSRDQVESALRAALANAEQEPAREWVGLTPDVIQDCWNPYRGAAPFSFARNIEKWLREKNTGQPVKEN